jgi:mannose-6-phosphate isomerase-like protein (cupin superfamily)
MIVRRPEECVEIVANDGCRLRELLHPDRGAPGLSYSLAVATLGTGESTLPHCLTHESEAYYIVSGSGRLFVDGHGEFLREGDVALVPAGSEQWIECAGPEALTFLNIVDPPWQSEHDLLTDRD